MNTFENLKILIVNKKRTKEKMLEYMDLFLMNNRITSEQYEELIKLIDEVGLE